ncbi:MAG: hypothetical protein ABIP78_01690 [Pyrinomonadaceae bacterium]
MKNQLNLCLAIFFLVVLGCSCPKLSGLVNKGDSSTPRSTPISDSPSSSPNAIEGDYDLTMDKYKQLRIGQARSEVERILGGKGTEISSSTGGGMRFSVNKWEGEKYQSVILSFRNDKIMSKSQVGLK